MRNLKDKRALVTGAASGIGRAIALELAATGTDLVLGDRDDIGLARTADEARKVGVQVVTRHYDAALPDEVVSLAQFAESQGGGVDILVNNAGITYRGPTDRMEVAHWEQMLDVNLYAPVRLTHELLPMLLARREVHILNVCSVLGLVGLPKVCAYNTTKFGLVGFTESLRSEYGVQGVGVTALCPGLVRTNLFSSSISNGHEKQKNPPNWATTTSDRVARAAIKAIRRNRGMVVMEPVARVTYALKRFVPSLLDWGLHLGRRRQIEKRLAYWNSQNSQRGAQRRRAA
ncbi:MAG: SDR family NAD(P)-dependent oxidoreductase [Aeoliella sp.]